MKRSRRELSIDMVIHTADIFENELNYALTCFTFTPKTKGFSSYCMQFAYKGRLGKIAFSVRNLKPRISLTPV